MAEDKTQALLRILGAAPVVPVLIVDTPETAVPLGRALVAGGLTALEITLRTPQALDCIKAMASEVEGADVGAGTIIEPGQGEAAIRAGARFIVSPVAVPELDKAALEWPVPFLPGVATATEAVTSASLGYRVLKFFPAEPAGGVPYLKSLFSPLPFLRFCPTGGIGAANAPNYLALENVICVGGSWVAPPELIAAQDWPRITELARAAVGLRKARPPA